MPVSLGRLFNEIRQELLPVSGELAERDTEHIFEQVIHFSRSELYANFSLSVEKPQEAKIRTLAKQRLTGTPLPYVLGHTWFYSKKFRVTPDVLIPRPDTEILIDTILQQEKDDRALFLDIGTGSGIIAETLTDTRPRWRAVAVDISIPALNIARSNCSTCVLVVGSDKLSAFKPGIRVDFIASNPPYLSTAEMKNIDKSVKEYEPLVGLGGGQDGLDFYRYLAVQGKPFIKRGGRIYCEIGASQNESVTDIFSATGWNAVSLRKDLAGRSRVVVAQNAPD